MRTVTKYVADDGSEWRTPDEAEDRDLLIERVAEAMKPLGDKPTGSGYVNGEGYRRHALGTVAIVKADLIELSRVPLRSWMAEQEAKHGTKWADVHPSWFCRFLDGGHEPLELAWSRLWSIDSQGREWGQIYYADHPGEAKFFEV